MTVKTSLYNDVKISIAVQRCGGRRCTRRAKKRRRRCTRPVLNDAVQRFVTTLYSDVHQNVVDPTLPGPTLIQRRELLTDGGIRDPPLGDEQGDIFVGMTHEFRHF